MQENSYRYWENGALQLPIEIITWRSIKALYFRYDHEFLGTRATCLEAGRYIDVQEYTFYETWNYIFV